MKTINKYKALLFSGCALLLGGLSSCDDFLTLHPTNQITEEEFWEDKSDLQSAVAGCYRQFLNSDIIARMIYWGECRSDNFVMLTANGWTDMTDLMNANLQETNSMFSWAAFYKDIAYCNKVLEHGPVVVERDPSFSVEDWRPIEAEMKALRALNYFYLVRAFRDVPLVLTPVGSDKEALAQRVRQTPAQEVLTTIINDLDSVKDYGMVDYGANDWNKGRVTRDAIYTLLADMYLWRASKNASPDSIAKYPDPTGEYASLSEHDYAMCVKYCDYVLDRYKSEYDKNLGFGGNSALDQDNPYRLIQLERMGNTKNVSDDVFRSLFVSGNSRESIFELQFDGSKNTNSVLFGRTSDRGLYTAKASQSFDGNLQGVGFATAETEVDATSNLYSQTDIRRWWGVRYTGESQATYPIAKYTHQSILHADLTDSNEGASMTKLSTNGSSGWIIYRITDVMLMKAEALNWLADDEASREKAFDLVTAVLYRANPTVSEEKDRLKLESYATQADMDALILRERRREFFAEGKRWFDLVRKAEREASPTNMVSLILTKYSSNINAIRAKMSTMNSLYNPVTESELDANNMLYQNPAWKRNETISKN